MRAFLFSCLLAISASAVMAVPTGQLSVSQEPDAPAIPDQDDYPQDYDYPGFDENDGYAPEDAYTSSVDDVHVAGPYVGGWGWNRGWGAGMKGPMYGSFANYGNRWGWY